MSKNRCLVENLDCPNCGAKHEDIDHWADKPHKTHLCLDCGRMFEGSFKAVSHPRYTSEYLEMMKEG